jgi:hypothetical protein
MDEDKRIWWEDPNAKTKNAGRGGKRAGGGEVECKMPGWLSMGLGFGSVWALGQIGVGLEGCRLGWACLAGWELVSLFLKKMFSFILFSCFFQNHF